MDFGLNASQEAYRHTMRDVGGRLSSGALNQRDAEGLFNREHWMILAEQGIQGALVPVEYGGEGLDVLTFVSGMEALGESCKDAGLLFSVSAHVFACVLPIAKFGTDEQKRYWLPRLGRGGEVAAIAIAEAHGASDAFNLETVAREEERGYRITGRKTYITNGPFCDVALVFARVDGSRNVCCFLVEKSRPGMRRGGPVEKVGMRTSPFGDIFFENCFVPREAVLGKPDTGKMVFINAMEWERGCILAAAVGAMKRQVKECVEYLRHRKSGEKRLLSHQVLQHRVVDMKVRAELSRLALYQFAWERQTTGRANFRASLAKLYISEAVLQNALDALQIQGAFGYTSEADAQREVRDSLAYRIASGTSDIQRNILAQWLLRE